MTPKSRKTKPRAPRPSPLPDIDEINAQLDAPIPPDAGDMRLIPIDTVRPDPDNPRHAQLSWKIVQTDPDELTDPQIRTEVREIASLASTLREIGQRQPIEVVIAGNIFRIVFGERRYWAARLCGLTTVKAIVLRQAPRNTPRVQHIENNQRRGIAFYRQILNIRAAVDREAALGTPLKEAKELQTLLGLGRTTAFRYWKCIDLPEDIDAMLASGTIHTLDEIEQLLTHPTAELRQNAIAQRGSDGPIAQASVPKRPSRAPRRRPGRPRTLISFGSTDNAKLAQYLFKRLAPGKRYLAIDFTNPDAVTLGWKQLLKSFEDKIQS